MSYFNPRIYNIQNLKKQDRMEVSYWRNIVREAAERSKADMDECHCHDTLEKIRAEIGIQAIDEFLESFDIQVAEIIVGLIDGYGDEIEVMERPEIQSKGGLEEWDEKQDED